MYMRYTYGQNEEYLLFRSTYVLNQVLTKQIPLYCGVGGQVLFGEEE